jgi:hypothetical protein
MRKPSRKLAATTAAAIVIAGWIGSAVAAPPVLTFSTTATPKPGNLVEYVLSLASTGGGAGVAGFSLTITPNVPGHLNQVLGGNSRFNDLNSLMPDATLDSQFAFSQNDGTVNVGPSPSADTPSSLAAALSLINAQFTTARPIAQVVLPAGEGATFNGQVTFFQGQDVPQNVTGTIPAPEPAGIALVATAAAAALRRRRR